jgi:hypothetical protein
MKSARIHPKITQIKKHTTKSRTKEEGAGHEKYKRLGLTNKSETQRETKYIVVAY